MAAAISMPVMNDLSLRKVEKGFEVFSVRTGRTISTPISDATDALIYLDRIARQPRLNK